MRLMGIQAIYPRRSSSSPGKGHKRYPYLLRNLPITHVNQVWSADITYVPLLRGFMYLVAVIDWHSRYVLAWQLSNILDGGFCLDALRQALVKGQLTIFNTDQGAQFTADAFTACLQPIFGSAWTAAPSTTSSANAYGAASSTKTSISTSMTRSVSCRPG